jgi:hypothetical protein
MKPNMFTRTLLLASALFMVTSSSFSQKKEVKVQKEIKEDKEIKEEKKVKEQKEIPTHPVEISKEVEAPKGAVIHINSSGRNLDIHTWTDNKVKVVTTVDVEDGKTADANEWFDKMGLTLKSLNNRVDLNATHPGNAFFTFNDGKGLSGLSDMNLKLKVMNRNLEVLKEKELKDKKIMEKEKKTLKKEKENLEKEKETMDKEKEKIDEIKIEMDTVLGPHSKMKMFMPRMDWNNNRNFAYSYNFNFDDGEKKTLTIYVPAGSKIDIDDKNGDITLSEDYKDATIKISNASLDARKIDNLNLIAKYSNVNIGDVIDAEIEFEHGSFTAGNIQNLDMDSKSSTIEYESGNTLTIRSQNDNYNIESLQKLEGRKMYGELRITKLYKSIDLEGANADVKIRHLMPEVEKVKINDKYADIRLPVRDLKNYTVSFRGNYSSVFAPFEKVVSKETDKTKDTDKTKANTDKKKQAELYSFLGDGNRFYTFRDGNSEKGPTNFTASVGDTKGQHTQFEIVCEQCSIDFK